MKFTILGSTGFIGTKLSEYLKDQSYECFFPSKEFVFDKKTNLGHVIYCIGLTSDFRQRPFDTVKAHVCKLLDVLENSNYESFLYLSSTRVYNGSDVGKEDVNLSINSSNFSDLYNISKLMGESICFSIPNEKVRVVRLSNVIGEDFNSDNFIFSLIKDAVEKKKIILSTSVKMAKDYILIDDVVRIITMISQSATGRIYNVASGISVSNHQIINKLIAHLDFEFKEINEGETLKFPQISIERIQREYNFTPKNFLDSLDSLILEFKKTKI